jgi:hypoxanthine phosphoribosyltransferase
VQIMDLMKQKLHNNKPIIFLDKYFPWEIVAQKTLKWDLARNKNANNTIFPRSWQKWYTKVLLADDFIWSGATLNISAKKLKESWLATIVIGFAIVGNMDLSYEFVSEV